MQKFLITFLFLFEYLKFVFFRRYQHHYVVRRQALSTQINVTLFRPIDIYICILTSYVLDNSRFGRYRPQLRVQFMERGGKHFHSPKFGDAYLVGFISCQPGHADRNIFSHRGIPAWCIRIEGNNSFNSTA